MEYNEILIKAINDYVESMDQKHDRDLICADLLTHIACVIENYNERLKYEEHNRWR